MRLVRQSGWLSAHLQLAYNSCCFSETGVFKQLYYIIPIFFCQLLFCCLIFPQLNREIPEGKRLSPPETGLRRKLDFFKQARYTFYMKVPFIAPSLLSADFSAPGEAVQLFDSSGADWVHLDVMDGSFVPNITFGHKLVADVRPFSRLPFDVHLMTNHPDRHIADFARAGADFITIHTEAAVHIHRILGAIRELGKKAGIAVVPSTPVSALTEILSIVDLVLVMTVNPGFGGQKLIPGALDKVRTLCDIRKEKNAPFLISVDGGMNVETACAAREAGVDVIVTGSAFFDAADKTCFMQTMRGA
jgi:ribulose-phosphate 3-epimerase